MEKRKYKILKSVTKDSQINPMAHNAGKSNKVTLNIGELVEGYSNGQLVVIVKNGAIFELILGTEVSDLGSTAIPTRAMKVRKKLTLRGLANKIANFEVGEIVEGVVSSDKKTLTVSKDGDTYTLKIGEEVASPILVDVKSGIEKIIKKANQKQNEKSITNKDESTNSDSSQKTTDTMVQPTADTKKNMKFTAGGLAIGAIAGYGVAKLMKKTDSKTQIMFTVVGGLALAAAGFAYAKYSK